MNDQVNKHMCEFADCEKEAEFWNKDLQAWLCAECDEKDHNPTGYCSQSCGLGYGCDQSC